MTSWALAWMCAVRSPLIFSKATQRWNTVVNRLPGLLQLNVQELPGHLIDLVEGVRRDLEEERVHVLLGTLSHCELRRNQCVLITHVGGDHGGRFVIICVSVCDTVLAQNL